jgi:hypothetical protein
VIRSVSMASFTIKFGKRTRTFTGTPREAAREAAKLAARGTFDRSKTIYQQTGDAELPARTMVLDERGAVMMTCQPSIVSPRAARAGRRVRHTFAQCTIAPGFLRPKRGRKRKG